MNVRGQGFSKVITVKKAQELLFSNTVFQPEKQKVRTTSALDRVLAGSINATGNLPGFKRSAMDGFALQAKDTYGASETSPIILPIKGMVEIGSTETTVLQSGSVIRISTGAPLPKGADAVLKLEDCELLGDDRIDVMLSINPGKNVAKEDEDIKKGVRLFDDNHLLKPWDIAMLESLGIHDIDVYRLPRIAIFSTGNELVSAYSTPIPGQVIDSNRPAIVAWLAKYNVNVVISEHIPDDVEIIKSRLLKAASKCDLIITTGGTSVGTKDFLPEIISSIGDLYVHGISIRPGKPVALGNIIIDGNGTPIIALPGYPLAAFLNFDLFVSPLLHSWTKLSIPWREYTDVKLLQKVPSTAGVRDFVRLKRNNDHAQLIRITGAGILSSLVFADYLLEIPEDVEGYEQGSVVRVRKMRDY